MKTEIVKGSIADLAGRENVSLAESFLSCDCIILFDVSGSMADVDRGSNVSRFERGCEELRDLQESLPGKIAVVQFSCCPKFMPGGMPVLDMGSTNLTQALTYIECAKDIPGMKFILISDGEPDSESSALDKVRRWGNPFDVIFIGDETDRRAKDFMRRFAEASGGSSVDCGAEVIKEQVMLLLGAGS